MGRKPVRQLEHALVHPVRLGIAGQEVAPDPAAQKRALLVKLKVVPRAFDQARITPGGGRRQGPFVHLAVGGGGQVDQAATGMSGLKLGVRGGHNGGRGEHAFEKLDQPAARVDPVIGVRPDPEFLDVIEIDRRLIAARCQPFEIAHGIRRRGERQAVAQAFVDRKQIESAAFFLGGIKTVERGGGYAGA